MFSKDLEERGPETNALLGVGNPANESEFVLPYELIVIKGGYSDSELSRLVVGES